ncbi:MAG TPA: SoxR reducing system RseC family protein [Thermotogota bacterium]|nr:SoxR reducing system RseC family protein [Thermotogota bacterium]
MERPKEVWIVKETEKEPWITIEKSKPGSCDSCSSLSFCNVKNVVETLAKNASGKTLRPGQHVLVEVPIVSLTKTAFFLYGIPTVALVASLLLFIEGFGMSQTQGLLYALLVLAGVFLALRFYDKAYAKNETHIARILAVLPEIKNSEEGRASG